VPSTPGSAYALNIAGIPESYTQGLENTGYVQTPFATQEQEFQHQAQYQRLLKQVLDLQMGGPNGPYGGNPGMLPYSMRNFFGSASSVFRDPLYSVNGAGAFLDQSPNGYQFGDLPNNPQASYTNWYNAAHNYPNIPAPNPVIQSNGGGGSSGGGGGSKQGTQQYTVGLAGGGSITVNAHDPASAITNASQGGNHPTDQVQQGGYRF
jgi:hypothetical protein